MKSRWWIAADGVLLVALWCGGFLCGRKVEHGKTVKQIQAYQAKAAQADPLIRQWRTGYEQLQKTCVAR